MNILEMCDSEEATKPVLSECDLLVSVRALGGILGGRRRGFRDFHIKADG
jgi:hypothetical protein